MTGIKTELHNKQGDSLAAQANFLGDENPSGSKKVIVVLGMHRSGTSAVTRGLQELGVELGANLMAAEASSNPKGFWEDLDVFALSERLLGAVGQRWDCMRPIVPATWKRPEIDRFRLEGIELVAKKTAGVSLWGFKDPRTVRLLPFWKSVFEALALEPHYVICIRNPLSVARSLEKRDGFALEKSCLLWLEHSIAAVAGTPGSRRVVVDYDLVMDDPVGQLERMASALALDAPSREALAESEYVRDFLSAELRHTRYGKSVLDAHPAFAGLVREAYELLLQAAEGHVGLDELQQTEAWLNVERTARAVDVFSAYFEDRDSQLQTVLAEKAAQSETLAQRDQEIRLWAENLAELEQGLIARDGRIAQLEADIQRAGGALAEREERINALNQTVTEREGRIDALNRAVAEREERIDALNRAVAEREERIDASNRAVAEREERIDASNQAIAERAALSEECARALAERDAALEELGLARMRIAGLLGSTSWRVTAPLRLLKRGWPVLKQVIREWVRAVYLALPMPMGWKLRVKGWVFALSSPFIRNTAAYKNWLMMQTNVSHSQCKEIQLTAGSGPEKLDTHPSDQICFGVDIAILVPRQGILLRGWLDDSADTIKGFIVKVDSLSLGFSSKSDCQWYERSNDRTCAGEAKLTLNGFWLWLASSEIPSQASLANIKLELSSGKYSRAVIAVSTSPDNPMPMIQNLLESFDPSNPSFENTLFAIGPAVAEMWKNRNVAIHEERVFHYGAKVSKPKVSIIVPLYGRIDFVKYQLSLFADDLDFQRNELIYVLDDPRLELRLLHLCEQLAPLYGVPFKVICHGGNLGFSGATNLGVRHSCGRYLILLNSDVMPKQGGWVGKLLSAYQALSGVGALSGTLLFEDESVQHQGMTPIKIPPYRSIWFNTHPGKGLPDFKVSDTPYTVPAVTGALLFVERTQYLKHGGLDEDFILGDFEDSDFCYKLLNVGLTNYCLPSVKLYHLERQSLREIGSPRWRQALTLYNAWLHSQRWSKLIELNIAQDTQ